jgi:hypothetical protein
MTAELTEVRRTEPVVEMSGSKATLAPDDATTEDYAGRGDADGDEITFSRTGKIDDSETNTEAESDAVAEQAREDAESAAQEHETHAAEEERNRALDTVAQQEAEHARRAKPGVAEAAGASATGETVQVDKPAKPDAPAVIKDDSVGVEESPETADQTPAEAVNATPVMDDPRPREVPEPKRDNMTADNPAPEVAEPADNVREERQAHDKDTPLRVEEEVHEVLGVPVTNEEHEDAMANNGRGADDRQRSDREREAKADDSPSSHSKSGRHFTEGQRNRVREGVRMSGLLGDPDESGTYDLEIREAVNELLPAVIDDGRRLSELAMRDFLNTAMQPFTLKDAIKELALNILVREVDFYEPFAPKGKPPEPDASQVEPKAGKEEKAKADKEEAERKAALELEEKKKDEEAKKDDEEAVDDKEESTKDEIDDTKKKTDGGIENEDPEGADDELDEEFPEGTDADAEPAPEDPDPDEDKEPETEKTDPNLEADPDGDSDGKPEDDTNPDGKPDDTDPDGSGDGDRKPPKDGEEESSGPPDPTQLPPLSKEEKAMFIRLGRHFGMHPRYIRQIGPEGVRQRVLEVIEARIQMGQQENPNGSYADFTSEDLIRSAIIGAITQKGDMDHKRLADLIHAGTHIASYNLVHLVSLRRNHWPSRLKPDTAKGRIYIEPGSSEYKVGFPGNKEMKLTMEENYATLRAALHHPNPVVRREARVALHRRAEWTGTAAHTRLGAAKKELSWQHRVQQGNARNNAAKRLAHKARRKLFGEPRPVVKGAIKYYLGIIPAKVRYDPED